MRMAKSEANPAYMSHRNNVGLMLGQRRGTVFHLSISNMAFASATLPFMCAMLPF